jgi:hypothetical protein
MKSAAWLNWADDWLNPIAVKELRQAVKSRVVMVALLLFLLLQLGILLVILLMGEYRRVQAANLHAGREVFPILQGILLGTCMLLIPSYAGVRLAAEHSDTNVDLLFISTLRPRAIIAGKFQAAVVLILLIFSACAPFMTFSYLLRGIDIPTILLVLGLDFLAVLLGTQLAIFLGAVPANWGMKAMLLLAGLGLLGGLFGLAMFTSIELLDSGLGSRMDTPEFWLVAGALVTAILAIMGLLFAWSVAIVTPPSANRALPVRLYLLGAWIVTASVALLLTRHFDSSLPLQIWLVPVGLLFSAQILTSVNEREQWGLRVARTIPRRWWLRVPAFLVYSGSAGGVLFAVLLLSLSIGLTGFVLSRRSGAAGPLLLAEVEIGRRNVLVMVVLALYTFDFSMTAVFLRTVLGRGRIKALYTWIIALMLAGLGFSLPFLILFLFDNEDLRMGNVDPWWYITNPVVTMYNVIWEWRRQTGADFRTGCLVFLSVWAGLVSLSCLPWMVRQAARFRPPPEKVVAAD